MQTQKGSGSSEPPKKRRPQAVGQLKTKGLESDSASVASQVRTHKERSPKIVDRRSPRSPVTEQKRPSRISILESQVSQLAEELNKAKDQLSLSESWKKEAEEDAELAKKQLVTISSKLKESQKKLLELSNSELDPVVDRQSISLERDQAWKSKLEAIQQQQSVDEASLASVLDEIQQLKVQLEMLAESDTSQHKNPESGYLELQTLKANLMDAISLLDNMKSQLIDSKNSEAEAQALARETLHQLETAKKSVVALRLDGLKSIEAYNSIASELEQSKARVKLLEELVSKLETELNNYRNSAGDLYPIARNRTSEEANMLDGEVYSLKSEIERLRSALESAERKCHEEQIHNALQIRSTNELVEQIKSDSLLREAKLEAELKQAKADFEEVKADLMDKETELQGISEENYELNMKLRKGLSCQRESGLETELSRMTEEVADMKASLMDKEKQLQNILEENKANVELEAARTAEREASVKLGLIMEEADRSSKRVARLTEQLEASQAANSEMEADLRRIKVQSDQWRKAAEAAVAMLASGNNGKFIENSYDHITGKMGSPYNEDMGNEMLRKRNGNMLKKIGVLWKKTQI